MKYKLVMFDMDGTILDTIGDIADSVNHVLREHNLQQKSTEEVLAMLGNGMKVLIHKACPDGTSLDAEDVILKEFKAYYKDHCSIKTRPFDGILELLEELKKKGVKTCVVSNKGDFAVQELSKTYFDGLLDASAGENEVLGIAKKPAPDMCLKMMELFGVSKEEAVYVGDTEVDIETAKNTGIDCIICSWGFRSVDYLVQCGATCIVNSVEELKDLIVTM